jgi:hypothetical protein
VALENQQSFQAPSLPKMGKDSSPLMKSANKISFSFAKPKLKTSKMSFVRVKKAQAIKAEDLKGPETVSTGSLATTLTETNKILVEIQNQLAIDFANRIAEKKQTLKLSRKQVKKKKLVAKEDFVERGKGLAGNIKDFGKKILSPIKGIFDKIIEFLTIVGTGIALNAAFEWLSDDENREKLVRVFNFLRDHWETLLAIAIGGKILGLLLKLKGLFSLARSLTRRIGSLSGKKPPQPTTQTPKPVQPKPVTPKPVTPKPGTPTPTQTKPSPILDSKGNPIGGQRTPKGPLTGPDGRTNIRDGREFAGQSGKRFEAPKFPKTPKIRPSSSPLSRRLPGTLPRTPLGGGGGGGLGNALMMALLVFGGPIQQKADESDIERILKLKETDHEEYKKEIDKLRSQAQGVKYMGLLDGIVDVGSNARKLKQLGELRKEDIPLSFMDNLLPESMRSKLEPDLDKDGKPIQGYSKGGTIPGDGPTNVDSVPTILAPKEEVIQAPAANRFRPVLKDINNNYGRMFLSFKSGVEQQARNFALQQEETNRTISLFKEFSDLVEKRVRKLEMKEYEKSDGFRNLLNIIQGGQSQPETQTVSVDSSSTQPQTPLMSNTTPIFSDSTMAFIQVFKKISEEHENNKPKTPEPELEPVKKSPIELQVVPFNPGLETYDHRIRSQQSSGEGSIETMNLNLPPTVIKTPKQQQQAQPQEQPRESSSSDILIAPMDLDNPFFGRSFSAYGVEL